MAIRHPVPGDGEVSALDYHADHVFDGPAGMLLDAAGNLVDPEELTVAGTSDGLSALFTTIASVPAPVTAFWTSGYSAAGRGAARYIADASVVADALPTQRLIGGRGFRLDPEQRLTIEMFGAVGDWNGTTGTDNYAAIIAATLYTPKSDRNYVPRIHWSGLSYYSSATININRSVHWVGEGRGNNTGSMNTRSPTRLVVPQNTVVIRNHNSNTTPTGAQAVGNTSGGCSIYEQMNFEGAAAATTRSAYGFHMRGTCIIRQCGFYQVGHGVYIATTATAGGVLEGDSNNWVVDSCFFHTINGDCLHITGQDANAGLSTHIVTAGNTINGCAIYDSSGLGNVHLAPQCTGYGNTGVSHGGILYMLRANNTDGTLGKTVTPGTNSAVWYPLRLGGPTASFPAWSNTGTYYLALPLFISQNATTVLGGYEEHGAVLCHVEGTIIGGGFSLTSDCAAWTNSQGTLISNREFGFQRNNVADAGNPEYVTNGDTAKTLIGSVNAYYGANYRRNILEHFIGQDGSTSQMYWGWEGKDQQLAYLNQKPMWSFGGPATARTYGRDTAQPYVFTVHGLGLQDTTDSNNRRIMDLRFSAPPSAGNHAAGEIAWISYKSVNFPMAAYTCTAPGTPGTWKVCASVAFKGSTASRPTDPGANDTGVMYFDTTLAAAGKPIWWTGSAWVDATGATV